MGGRQSKPAQQIKFTAPDLDTLFTLQHASSGLCAQPNNQKLYLSPDCSQSALNHFRRLDNGAIMHSSGWCVAPSGKDLVLVADCVSSPWTFNEDTTITDAQPPPPPAPKSPDVSSMFLKPKPAPLRGGNTVCWGSAPGSSSDNDPLATLLKISPDEPCADGWNIVGTDRTAFRNQIPGYRYAPVAATTAKTSEQDSEDSWSWGRDWNFGYQSQGSSGAPVEDELDDSYNLFSEEDVLRALKVDPNTSRQNGKGSNRNAQQAMLNAQNYARKQKYVGAPSGRESTRAAEKRLFEVPVPTQAECSSEYR